MAIYTVPGVSTVDGVEQVTTLDNSNPPIGANPFEVFTGQVGNFIDVATNSSSAGECRSNVLTVNQTDVYLIKVTLTVASGSFKIRNAQSDGTWISGYSDNILGTGVNTFYHRFTDTHGKYLWFSSVGSSSSATDITISLQKVTVHDKFPNIKDAILFASTGDTIIVSPGTYNELNIDIDGKAISVIGTEASTIIDCNQSGRGFQFNSYETTATVLQGFTIKDGSAIDGNGGGGIRFYGTCAPIVKNITIDNCHASHATTALGTGGGIEMDGFGAKPTLEDITIKNCTSTGNGGGMYGYQTSRDTRDNIFKRITVHGCTVGAGYGGGVCFETDASPVIEDITIYDCSGTQGGGLAFVGCNLLPYPTLDRLIVYANNCIDWGGGIASRESGGVYRDSLIYGNTATNQGGGAYHHAPVTDGAIQFINCTFSKNHSGNNGGGISWNIARVLIKNSIIYGNTAVTSNPEVYDTNYERQDVTYSNIGEALGGTAGAGNINSDPYFVDSANNDYHLQSYSPSIGTGLSGADMGCYSFQAVFRPDEPRYKAVLYSHLLRHNFQIMDFNMRGGRERFNGSSGVVIELPAFPAFSSDLDHPSSDINYSVIVTPDNPASILTVGDITVINLKPTSFTVKNSGANVTDYFTWTTAYNNYTV